MLAGTQIPLRQKLLETLKRPFSMRRINRVLHSIQLNLTRNSGYYALVSSLLCLCFLGLRSSVDTHDHDDIDYELHHNFHNWESKGVVPVKTRERRASDPFSETKIVLFWTKYHGSASFDFGLGSRPFEEAGCKFSNCKTTTDRLLLNESHALIFHSGNLNESDIPSVRFDHQKWIFYTFTSPINMAPLPKSLNSFTLTAANNHELNAPSTGTGEPGEFTRQGGFFGLL